MGCHDTYDIGRVRGLEAMSLNDKEKHVQVLGRTALGALEKYQPINQRDLIDLIAAEHGASTEGAAYVLARLEGNSPNYPVRISLEGSVTLA